MKNHQLNIAFITNKPYEECETFIKAQIDGLPFNMKHYWGDYLPFQFPVLPPTFLERQLLKMGLRHRITIQDVVCKVFEEDKINIVLAQYGMMGAEVLPVCKTLGLPLVVHFHGHDVVRSNVLEAYETRYKEMFSYAKVLVVSVSHVMTKKLIALGCPEHKIMYNPYGPNDSFLSLSPKFRKPQFISVGRFVEKKAPYLTILAFNKILKLYPTAKLVMAGTGPLLGSCKDLVEALGINSQVVFPEYISSINYQAYLLESTAYVQHSITAQDGDMEGTPVSILEASGSGLPVISTYHAGIIDVIVDGETGLLVEEKDFNGMAKHMIWILEHKQEAIQMGEKGKIRVSELYNINRYLANLKNTMIRGFSL